MRVLRRIFGDRRGCFRVTVVSIEIELPTALENAQLPAFSSLLQLISKRNDYNPLYRNFAWAFRSYWTFYEEGLTSWSVSKTIL